MVKVMKSFVRGPLAPHVAGLAAELLEQGYTQSSAEQHMCFVAHLDRWLMAEGLGVQDLSRSMIQRYLVERRAAGYVLYRSTKAMVPLLGFLTPLGLLPAEPPPELDAVEETVSRYGDYLLTERGLTPGTVEGYVHWARRFLASGWDGEQLDLAGMTAADVLAFVLASCPGRATGSAKLIVTVTRSVLGWLHLTGILEVSLAEAVPSVAGWRLPGLPQALSPAQQRAMLGVFDRRTADGASGLRDRAAARPVGAPVRGGRPPRPGRHRLACRGTPHRREGKPRGEPSASGGRRRGDHGLPATRAPSFGEGPQRLRPRPRPTSGD